MPDNLSLYFFGRKTNAENAQPSPAGEKTVDAEVVDAEFEEVKKD